MHGQCHPCPLLPVLSATAPGSSGFTCMCSSTLPPPPMTLGSFRRRIRRSSSSPPDCARLARVSQPMISRDLAMISRVSRHDLALCVRCAADRTHAGLANPCQRAHVPVRPCRRVARLLCQASCVSPEPPSVSLRPRGSRARTLPLPQPALVTSMCTPEIDHIVPPDRPHKIWPPCACARVWQCAAKARRHATRRRCTHASRSGTPMTITHVVNPAQFHL